MLAKINYEDDGDNDVDEDDGDDGDDDDADEDDDGDANCEQVIWETADLPVNLCLPAANHPPTEDTKYKILVQIQI